MASPVVLGGDNGLEMQYWVVSDDGPALKAALGGFLDHTAPIDPGLRQLLEQNGIRVFAVPVDRLGDVRGRLAVIGAVQRQWLGQVPSWVDTATGPMRDRGQTISLHDGPLRLGPGRLRLLVRCWTVPVPPSSAADSTGKAAALHLEVVPQHQEVTPEPDLSLSPRRVAAEDEGLMFTRLRLTARLDGSVALVLVPEGPGATWEAPPPLPPVAEAAAQAPRSATPALGQVSRGGTPAPEPAEAGPAVDPPTPAPALAGPPSSTLPSLGEAMLMSRPAPPSNADSSQPGRTLRAIVVLTPRVPDRFDLIPR